MHTNEMFNTGREGGRVGGREGGRVGGREGGREGGMEGGRVEGRGQVEEREGVGREGGREKLSEKCVRTIASFPGLLRFFLWFAFSIIHRSERVAKKMWGRPGNTYHMNDV